MERPTKLASNLVELFTAEHDGWSVDAGALQKTFVFQLYGAAIAFAVHIGFAAEKRDHHPEMQISWGKVTVRWSTHDAGGITALDLEMAELCDHAHRR